MSQKDHKKFDLIAIGAGSGGIATVNKAAQLRAHCALIEEKLLGGTCVNLGCVPKKLSWVASQMATTLREASHYGFEQASSKIDWQQFIVQRQAYIEKLRCAYSANLNKNNVEIIKGRAQFTSSKAVKVGDDISVIFAIGRHPNTAMLALHRACLTTQADSGDHQCRSFSKHSCFRYLCAWGCNRPKSTHSCCYCCRKVSC